MSFNEDELRKIQNATSGWFKKSARRLISQSLREFKPRVEAAKSLAGERRQAAIRLLVNEATALRKNALAMGATSHGHPNWAAAAACESWVQEMALGTPDSIGRVERVVEELISRT